MSKMAVFSITILSNLIFKRWHLSKVAFSTSFPSRVWLFLPFELLDIFTAKFFQDNVNQIQRKLIISNELLETLFKINEHVSIIFECKLFIVNLLLFELRFESSIYRFIRLTFSNIIDGSNNILFRKLSNFLIYLNLM